MVQLSVYLITLNASKSIAKCLQSLATVADEVVVLDSGSSDGTAELAAEFGAKVYQQVFSGFAEQKNAAAALCSFDWRLSIDADECLSEELRSSIWNWKQSESRNSVFGFNRLNHINNKPIKHAGWYPDVKYRLHRKDNASWKGGKVHEFLDPSVGIAQVLLSGDLLHFPFQQPEEHRVKTRRYALLAAEDKKHLSEFTLQFRATFSPWFKFFKMYFWQLGFLDGREGWWICSAAFEETRLKYQHALELKMAAK